LAAAGADSRTRFVIRWWNDLKPAAIALAPNAAALSSLALGVMLLMSGATPSSPARFVQLIAIAPTFPIETSHFVSSILGLLMVLLAFGLRARLDFAWTGSLVTALAAAVLAIFKGFNWEESVALLVYCAAFVALHDAFPRRSKLSNFEITPGWLLSALAALLGAAAVGWWSFAHADYANQPFWQALADDDAARAIRSWAGAAILLLAFGVWRMLATPATPAVVTDNDPDFGRVRAILAQAEVAEPSANLALLGDKRFLFSASGESFLMFGVRGRTWVALGSPVGRQDEQLDLLWRFREMADAHAARAAVFAFGPEALPDMVELGFAVQKTGESAILPLADFSLAGRKRETLRRNWRKAADGGAQFTVLPVGGAAPVMNDLKRISDAWLAAHAGGEKGFSMGGFSPDYLMEFPVAVVRQEGQVVAFASLWPTSGRQAFSMDLMRYSGAAPKNIMDFLFVELLEWGKSEGYGAFEFGMAPLAGLDDRPLAPVMSRLGKLMFERGEDIYNFQGVRRYKDKYDPIWRPRYIGAPHRWSIPFLLAEVGLLSSGGMRGLAKRAKRESTAAPPSARPIGAGGDAQQVEQVHQQEQGGGGG
jgi:phosphatidylglycerol lysyltransferase